MVTYTTQSNGATTALIIELVDDKAYVEANCIAYITGNITLDANPDGLKGKMRARVIGTNHYKPRLQGTGKIYLRSTLGCYQKLNLTTAHELVINNAAFVTCPDTIKLLPLVQPSVDKFLSGTPMITTVVQGNGTLILYSPGPLVEHNLKEDKFVAFANDVIAYEPQITVTREFAGNGWLNIAHKMVRVYRGSGKLYFCAIPNKGSVRK